MPRRRARFAQFRVPTVIFGRRFVVVEGYALAFDGRPRFTKDLALFIEPASDGRGGRHRAAQSVFGRPRNGRRGTAGRTTPETEENPETG